MKVAVKVNTPFIFIFVMRLYFIEMCMFTIITDINKRTYLSTAIINFYNFTTTI